MEDPPASERAATNRRDDDRESVRDDIRMDGERKHQRVHEGKPGRGPARARKFFISFKLTVSPS